MEQAQVVAPGGRPLRHFEFDAPGERHHEGGVTLDMCDTSATRNASQRRGAWRSGGTREVEERSARGHVEWEPIDASIVDDARLVIREADNQRRGFGGVSVRCRGR